METGYRSPRDGPDILMKVNQHFKLIETSGEIRELRGKLNQFEKRLDAENSRINDLWKATRLWFVIISLILGGMNIAILIMNSVQY